MHIVQTEDSATLRKTGLINHTEIIAPSGDGLYPKSTLDLNGDPRLPKLVDAVKEEIKQHHWTPEKNEKEICEATVKLMASDKFYGKYDPQILALQKDGTDQDSLYKLTVKNNHVKSLKDFKKNTLICKQEAAVTSYVLDSVGIPNDYCAGVTSDTTGINNHAFVQTNSGNIVEATDPKHAYYKTQNHKLIRNGDIAVVKDDKGDYQLYGSGNMPGIKAITYPFSFDKGETLTKQVGENVTKEALDFSETHPKMGTQIKKIIQVAENTDPSSLENLERLASENKHVADDLKRLGVQLDEETNPSIQKSPTSNERQNSKGRGIN